MARIVEFFIDETDRLSMSRLLLFFSFFVASWIVIVDTYRNEAASEGIFGIYIGAFVGSYVGGKWADRKPGAMNAPQVVVQTGTPAKVENNADTST